MASRVVTDADHFQVSGILAALSKQTADAREDNRPGLINYESRNTHHDPATAAHSDPSARRYPALVPHELSLEEIGRLKDSWREAVGRARDAGFEVVEVHGAHGYLIHSFLSPISNRRTDAYGGTLMNRMRLGLEIAEIVRAGWPDNLPVFFRVSSTYGIEGGWTLNDTVTLAKELKAHGIDVIDCSSGGIAGSATAARIKRTPGFQVQFAERVRREATIQTMAVGLILEADQAEAILEHGQADLIAIALFNPNWTLHAAIALGAEDDFSSWPVQYQWWLDKRQKSLVTSASEMPGTMRVSAS